MTLNIEELERLQKLSSIKLSADEQVKLSAQLQDIISFLDKLQDLEISDTKQGNIKEISNSLRTLEGVKDFVDSKKILENVAHEKINNSIVIKSVLS